MSDAFAYLSVLLSIILGLAIAEILQGYGALLAFRGRVRLYAPSLIWSVMMLLMATQFWWASFGLAGREHWNFAAFTAVLLQTIMLYMGSSIVLPKVRSDDPIDLREHYYREAGPFFTFGLLFLAVGYVKDWLLSGGLEEPIHMVFRAVFVLVTLLALVVRHPRLHEVIAPLMAALITIYFVMIFAQL
jgi:hypothetical protein